ncbi:acetyl-CoA carboxylase biotin carboxyl carrier protein [Gemmatimonas sp.]|jgi:acetyl-CoA carboxylase biotin carboxyl carrier protein|uniref:acetyl-CoA carboxylase biotin carboxyl carrier protein n=1 Tax=Gemmatimonas sp. TaxID=1962908 RepID=UPI0022C0D370|nr:acetyl-CoA carboxylase biotin carboxyl carrier protein [Gemmatimonas sp.]MCE2953931.1 acetyl-CoA carboxylase biotin carboxyl carrier protein [Gemmatimonas sp.]MCZ8013235.1 acetyl-CoA carboxylase biotin carboxyl carrier protein [Gemmatimonas sp.]MCZ8265509.1 acetyl-CoA carboxylase biotin carboxyl carrier protein [Gemmatimonas sp.]
MIDLRYVKKLIEMLDGSTVDSIEISSDKGMKLRISKSPQQRAAVAMAPALPAPVAVAAPAVLPAAAAARPTEEGGTAVPKAEAPKSAALEIKSPMVGTFYAAPEPGAKPYVSVGDRISKGQIVCIIEAMKIMNELESEFDGVVREIGIADTHAVEYGQVLFRIDPTG